MTELAVLRTRLFPPPQGPDVIERPELIARLEAGANLPLTLVVSPAGFGKSTLVSSWLAHSSCTSSWISLQADDNDPNVFLRYLLAALEKASPGSSQGTALILRARQLPSATDVAHHLLNELEKIGSRITVVFDDFHLIHDEWIIQFLATCIGQPSSPLHPVLISRSDPPLPLTKLRAAGHVNEIRSGSLRFGTDEVQRFIAVSLGQDAGESAATKVHERTEGWPTAVRLAVQSIHRSGWKDESALKRGPHGVEIFDALVAETLAEQPAAIREALLATSIVSEFSRGCARSYVPLNRLEHFSRDFKREIYSRHPSMRVAIGSGTTNSFVNSCNANFEYRAVLHRSPTTILGPLVGFRIMDFWMKRSSMPSKVDDPTRLPSLSRSAGTI